MGAGYRDYVIERSSAAEAGAPLQIDLAEADWMWSDAWPRQIARVIDAYTRSEWVLDLRRFGDRLQIRVVEYSADGLWMPHAWRDLPREAELWFALPDGLEVRSRNTAERRRA